MQKYILSSCSTADLTEERFKARDIEYICFHYMLDGKTYPDDLGKTMPFDKFYKAMADGADTKTSQVNVDEFINYFTPFLEAGQDILHICFSSGLSGSCNSAMIAREELMQKYPNRKLYVVDSFAASSGYGLLMDRIADLRDEGMGIDDLYAWANENKLKLHHWFFSTDLTFYIKGGRVSKTSGFVGTLLGICPLLNMDNDGKLIPRAKIRGKKKSIKKVVEKMEECADDGLFYDGKCYISHSACLEDAKAVAALVKDRFPRLCGEVEIYNIGTTIGSHTGPGTVALFFWGKPRKD
ncbi:MAG: DegV family protein [Clostridiales bacterium]|nr:DegV family protein [Clostridiales bacterium]